MAYSAAVPNRRNGALRVRVQGAQLGALGILPVVTAAVPSVSQILSKITTSLVSIVDPGKKRDANREARAEMWYQFASQGSITAARRLHGGTHFQYTPKEKQYYIDRWAKFQRANPTLAAQALQAGDLGIPEPGSGIEPPALTPDDQQAIQGEISAYANAHATGAVSTAPTSPALNIAQAGLLGGNFTTIVLGGALLYAVSTSLSKRRR